MNSRLTPPHDGFSDDRLLARALGLGDDSELQTALESSPALSERLAQMRADVSTISDRLLTAVPEADPDYADPAAARWQRLHASFQPAPVSSGHPDRWRLGRLATIAAAVALFAIVVAVAVERLPLESSGDKATEAARNLSGGGAALAPANTAPTPTPAAVEKGAASQSYDGSLIVLPQAEHYGTVVVARAGEVVENLQSLAVERVLKGRVTDTLSLIVRAGAAALPVGSLDVLYLHPLSDYWPAQLDDQKAMGGATISTGGADVALMPPPVSGYTIDGQVACVQPVPQGVAVSALAVP